MNVADIIGWICVIILIVAIGLAVHQRYFEVQKCREFIKDKLLEIQDPLGGTSECKLVCNQYNISNNIFQNTSEIKK